VSFRPDSRFHLRRVARLFGVLRENHGNYSVRLDENTTMANCSVKPPKFQVTLFSAANLNPSLHNLTVTNLVIDGGHKFFDLDFIVWEIDDTDPRFQYEPDNEWSTNPTNLVRYENRTDQ
jgi:hypothetical protein